MRTLSHSTQIGYSKHLRLLAKNVNLDNPEEVEDFVLDLDKKNKYKTNLFGAYLHYCKINSIEWKRPILKTETFPVRIPTEEQIDKIISGASLKYVIVFQLAKKGLRPDEIHKATLRDLDLPRRQLTVRTSKQGSDRTLTLKEETIENLRTYIARKGITDLNKKLFPKSDVLSKLWKRYCRKAYLKFRDPELLKIRLYDLRHWFGTTEYLKCRDIFHIKYLMGHRHIQSTLVYMHVAQGFLNNSEDFVCKVASSLEESIDLIEKGFEYITDFDGKKLFRKRK